MNVADSEALTKVLESAGYQAADNEKQADILLVNTCVVRQNAEDKAAWYITSAKGLKAEKPNLKIILCGCLAAEPGRDIKKQFPHVDAFIPPNQPERLVEFLRLQPSPPTPLPEGEGRKREASQQTENRGEGIGITKYITIMHGCDNFCSYCIVPYVRGREYSRPMDEVLSEIKTLVEQGITNITLLGQNVNSYKYGLANLLREIENLFPFSLARGQRERGLGGEGLISFLTSHPRDMSDEIIKAVAELPYVAKDFVMPLQSGDNEILKKMNRGYNLEHYLGRVKKIRSTIPQARISTDIIVGFPGETEEQFENTLRAIEKIKFNDVHMFAYSARPAVTAAKLPDPLPETVKQARLQKLIQVVRENLLCYNAG